MDDVHSGRDLNPATSAIVAARGTADGLVLRLDGRAEHSVLQESMRDFVSARRSFLTGNEVSLEWVGQLPESEFVDQIKDDLLTEFNVSVKSSKLREKRTRVAATADAKLERREVPEPEAVGISLFDGIDAMHFDDAEEAVAGVDKSTEHSVLSDTGLWDEPDARIYYGTVRSGQKIETEHTLVVFGDVNSGAELIAGGDIIILGNFRGVAHAGAYDETGGGRIIMALNMQPTQLRIGSIISRGSSDSRKVPELARIDGDLIVVENYHSKSWKRNR